MINLGENNMENKQKTLFGASAGEKLKWIKKKEENKLQRKRKNLLNREKN